MISIGRVGRDLMRIRQDWLVLFRAPVPEGMLRVSRPAGMGTIIFQGRKQTGASGTLAGMRNGYRQWNISRLW